MLDFLMVSTRRKKQDIVEIYPKFIITKTEDLMIRGSDFYAIWMEERGLWSTDENDALKLIDQELKSYYEENKSRFEDRQVNILYMWDSTSGMIDSFHKYCQKQMRDSFHMLDEKLIFSNVETTKKDYASKKLNYPLEPGKIEAYNKLMSTLYSPAERKKLEWAIGSIIAGDSKKIQKFMVLYGAAGTGKSTVLNIIQKLFEGYYSVFDAKALGSSNNTFALEAFKTNPLVAIQHDGDLSRIEDNTRLNSLVSHEQMTVNEKFKSTYSSSFKSFLFMGTNRPVQITDAKSGLLRRLIDVSPSGNKLDLREYKRLTKQIEFELGAIACHCRDVYLQDPGLYDSYIPKQMLGASNDFYNFIVDSYHIFKREDSTTLKIAWERYQTYCTEAKVSFPLSQRKFREELKNYFWNFEESFKDTDGKVVKRYYSGFRVDKFEDEEKQERSERDSNTWLIFDKTESILDKEFANFPAQYASSKETPLHKWENVKTKLKDLKTTRLHYVKIPEGYISNIVVDFDLKDEKGDKSLDLNIEAASKWPATYAELSKSGKGIHLHYIYTGDVTKLSHIFDDNIEVKVFNGNSSLRRKLIKCNDIPIATISSGLPLKEYKKVVNFEAVKNERALRTLIKRNINKEYHPNTKPSIDFIFKILEDAYNSDLNYDVSDLYNAVLYFATQSTNNSDYCIKRVCEMKFKSEDISKPMENEDAPLVFFDVEVFPNLLLIEYKAAGEGKPMVKMYNPTPKAIEELISLRLVGFNCRRYDNHILYACMLGATNEEIYKVSQRIIDGNKNAFYGEAYNLSYTDIYDFSSKKQSLKKWEIELGLHHHELGYKWDEPIPEEKWEAVAAYCESDVLATEAVFNHLKGDWTARQILADISGLSVNDTTNTLTTKIIFGNDRHPRLVYTDLATGERTDGSTSDVINAFPGYEYIYDDTDKRYHNMYRGTDVGFGGYVYAEPGVYSNVALLDVASMHPNSAVNMNIFGSYTQNFKDLLDARVAIKHGDFEAAGNMFNGRLKPYLTDKDTAAALSQALKIAINSVYGLTSASFENPFRDIRNKNNIVALRGALFMRTLQDEIQKRGFTVAHIKTDSIKIPNATPEIIQFVTDFGLKYGYIFEHEATYDRMCLVNDAVYIARYKNPDGTLGDWTATGTQFQVPYIFKSLFSKEKIEFSDLCETKSVTTALYLDFNEDLPEGEHQYHFVGKVGLFCPIKPGCGGGELLREGTDKEGNVKYSSATGAKGYRWLESDMVKTLKKEDDIDKSYYAKLADDAIDAISKYVDFEVFTSDEPWNNTQI